MAADPAPPPKERSLLKIRRLGPADRTAAHALLDLFADVFGEPDTYSGARPSDEYLKRLLARETFIALIAETEGQVVGGLVAYVLDKIEQARSEVYIYDLAVADDFRRRGIATALIRHTQAIAAELGAWVVFVQADRTDNAAIALYTGLGQREDVLHFDLPLNNPRNAPPSHAGTNLGNTEVPHTGSFAIKRSETGDETP
ncbi:AAC(3)-I family aminoglycoside N-acetyltransferase [Thioalkalivibrio sp. ALJ7]|uniref:AAC(3)-I family aminoglycoside N-acetyltransferase n=1 Tax=Thioalkalivibrio sp. ALJ7 TaxID=1158756 RepID=UPI00037BB82C|nr:AAC(3)-I family aminoglycoside N-acetyltransferase [Thioalkalivibrio sp. ALJ7]